MTFELDFGHTSQAGRKEVNEDFAALVLGQGLRPGGQSLAIACRDLFLQRGGKRGVALAS